MSGSGFFNEWGRLTMEWSVSAFCAATVDWIASKIPVRNGIFATLLSTAQLTTTYYLTNSLSGLFGNERKEMIFYADTWVVFNTIWMMSPTATNRLTASYRKLHMILYGSGPMPKAVSGGCQDGQCGTTQTPGRDIAGTPKAVSLSTLKSPY